MTYSRKARRNLLATSPDEPFAVALEITHPDLVVPIRVVYDTVDMEIEGELYKACRFELVLQDDVPDQVPTATLAVDNIGRELTQWLEYSNGGRGAKCRVMQVLRSSNEDYAAEDYFAEDYSTASAVDIEGEYRLDMFRMSITNTQVSSQLGYRDLFGLSAVAVRYDPRTAPGAF